MSDYEIRQYHPGDRAGFLSLHNRVLGRNHGPEWFTWKYETNPYIDHVPIFLALHDGEIVGARPLFALPIALGDDSRVALQPGDAMVHEDHRRQGVFSRMMEAMIERYSDTYPFYFTFPNDRSGPAHRKHGGQVVSHRRSYYRVENPENVATAQTDRRTLQLASKLGTLIAQLYHDIQDRRITVPSDLSVRTQAGVPAEELSALYRTAIPEEIHAIRDEQFYRWRFQNPDWRYNTYIGDDSSGTIAAIVTGTASTDGFTTTKLTDIVPLESAPAPALIGLIQRILRESRETDIFVAPSQGIPQQVLDALGFHADTRPPLSYLATQTIHIARPFNDNLPVRITDPENWRMTFAEEDTS
jgi:GNAT superfamily N-acetyltransferase